MTTSAQPSALTVAELDALRRYRRDPESVDTTMRGTLAAKGMLQLDGGATALTPAGAHALDVNHDATLPGIDN